MQNSRTTGCFTFPRDPHTIKFAEACAREYQFVDRKAVTTEQSKTSRIETLDTFIAGVLRVRALSGLVPGYPMAG